jgi:hypothetical protein
MFGFDFSSQIHMSKFPFAKRPSNFKIIKTPSEWENRQRNKSLGRLFSLKVKKLQTIIPTIVFEHNINVNNILF